MNRRILAVLAVVALLAGCGGSAARQHGAEATGPQATGAQPYKGMESRSIKALDPAKVDELLNGKGAGYALAAELNHYPGPSHVLELAGKLKLTPDQEAKTKEIQGAMRAEAKVLGQELVDLEALLDKRFASGQITAQEVWDLTLQIGTVEAKLRAVHLAAHLKVKALLSPQQVALNDQERGYGGGAHSGTGKHGH